MEEEGRGTSGSGGVRSKKIPIKEEVERTSEAVKGSSMRMTFKDYTGFLKFTSTLIN